MTDTEVLKAAGIDVDGGIAYCADDPGFYEEMLIEYLNESEAKIADLERYFSQRAWRLYAVCAHSVKSTSLTIGANKTADRARAMEAAGREEDESAILAGHALFIEEYKCTADLIRTALRGR